MPEGPLSVVLNLPPLVWRGKSHLYYDTANYRFGHEQAEHRFYGVRGASHHLCGAPPDEFPFKLWFMNSLEENSFPDRYNEWMVALLDGTPGKLEHPLRGPVDAIVKGGEVECNIKSTSGVIVNVTFTATLVDPNKAQIDRPVDVSVKAVAEAASAAVANAEINWPSGKSAGDLLSVLAQITSWLYSMDLTAQGQLNQWAGKLESYIDLFADQAIATGDIIGQAINSFPGNPQNWPAHTLLVQTWATLKDAAAIAGSNPARPTKQGTTSGWTTLDGIARDTGNDLGDIMQLNVALLASPAVPPKTVYTYYV